MSAGEPYRILIDKYAAIRGAELSYKLVYFIKTALFCPVFPDIIRISWISTFRGHYLHFVDITAFCGYYPYIVDISEFCGHCLYWSHYEVLSS